MNRIPIGFIGAGYISDWHLRAIKKLKHPQLVAVCDSDIVKAQSVARKYGNHVRCYDSWEQMLKDEKLTSVHVLLPPSLHYRAIKHVLESNTHVFVEKPLTLTLEEAQELMQISKKNGLHVGVNHNFLFYSIYENAKQIIQSNQIGPIKQITIKWNKELLQINKNSLDQWPLKNPSQLIMEAGVHAIASMLDLIGTPESFQVQVSSPFPANGIPNIYKHWQIQGIAQSAPFSLQYHFGQCFEEHSIQIDGQIGSILLDFEGNRMIVRKHTPYQTDVDRYMMGRSEANCIKRQAWKNFQDFIFETCGFQASGNAFGSSIRRSIEVFYDKLESHDLDRRHSPEFGSRVVEWSNKFARQALRGTDVDRNAASVRKEKLSNPPEIVVFGGSGFIGKELIRQLVKNGENVRVFCRNPESLPIEFKSNALIHLQKGDMRDSAAVESAISSAKVVYHLVTTGGRTWDESLQVDVNTSIALAKACTNHKIQRFIYLGSIASYYSGSRAITIDENTPFPDAIQNWHPYSRAKVLTEQKLMEIYKESGLPIVIFRPGIVIGKESSPFHGGIGVWKYNSICKMWGDGNNPLPLVLVEDVAKALIKAKSEKNINGSSFNLIGDIRLTAREYVQELSTAAKMTIEAIPTPIWRVYLADMSKWMIKSVLLYPNRQMPNYYQIESGTQKAFYNNAKAKKILSWHPVDDKQEWILKGIVEPVKLWLK